jgi:hypothetical protein
MIPEYERISQYFMNIARVDLNFIFEVFQIRLICIR